MSAGWPWEMRSAIVARVRDRNPMEVADDLGHRFWRLLPYGRPSRSYRPTARIEMPGAATSTGARFHRPDDSVLFNINVVAFQSLRLVAVSPDLLLLFGPVDRDSPLTHSSRTLALRPHILTAQSGGGSYSNEELRFS